MPTQRREIEVIARGAALLSGRVLLCRNVKHGYCYLPGGHVEFGERAADALVREFKEETGLVVQVGNCLLVSEGTFQQKGRERHEVNLVFHVEHPAWQTSDRGVAPVPSLEPKIAFEWVELAAVVDLDLRPESIKAWLASGARTPNSGGVEWVSATSAS